MHARLSIPLRDGREPDKASYHKVYRDIQRAIHKKQRQPILLERDQERAAQFDSRTRNALESLKQSLVPEPTLRLAPRLSCLPGKKVEARDCSQTSIKPRQKTSRPDTRQPGRVTNNTSAISSSRRNSVISSNRGPTPQNKSVQHLNKSIGVIGKENIPPVHSQNVIRPHLPVNTDNYRSVPVKKPSELNESRSEVTIIPKAMALKKDGSVLFIRKKVYHRTQIPVAEATKNYSSVPTPEPRERARSSLAIRPQQKLVAEVHNISSVLRERADDINDLVGDELSSIDFQLAKLDDYMSKNTRAQNQLLQVRENMLDMMLANDYPQPKARRGTGALDGSFINIPEIFEERRRSGVTTSQRQLPRR